MKTSGLTGAALDWAVAKCEGVDLTHGLTDDERYSTNWAQGGPIIEREGMGVFKLGYVRGWASGFQSGPTPLIAAMRCYCCAVLGDEVEIPEELK